MYYVTLAELLREQTGGKIDLLANPRMVDIARYPLVVALSQGTYVNFGDAVEQTALPLGVVQRIPNRPRSASCADCCSSQPNWKVMGYPRPSCPSCCATWPGGMGCSHPSRRRWLPITT